MINTLHNKIKKEQLRDKIKSNTCLKNWGIKEEVVEIA